MQVGLCHKCQMSLQFYDHDFPPLQWHIFIKNFWAFGIFQSSFTVTVSANTLVLAFTNTCDQIWKFLTLICLNKVLIFKTILTGPERKVALRRSGLSLIFPPIKPFVIVLALKVNGKIFIVHGCTKPKKINLSPNT